MRVSAPLLACLLISGACGTAHGAPPAAPPPATAAAPWLMPPPPAAPFAGLPGGAARPFVPAAAASFPLGLYANPLVLLAVKGVIGQLTAHAPQPLPSQYGQGALPPGPPPRP